MRYRTATLGFLAVTILVGGAWASSSTVVRENETVTVSVAALPALWGRPISEIALFRYEASSGEFVPIPFQVDEKLYRVFNPGTMGEFTELMYDVLGEDDGLLDADDEIVFRMGDAGQDRAPIQGAWVAGADLVRHDILIDDPLLPPQAPHKSAYLFTGSSLPMSTTSYVSWDGLEASEVTTDTFSLAFDGPWLLTELRVFGPCGSGDDLIDRFKGRAEPLQEQTQDEEDWNGTSSYLGGYAGPIRAIRYVQGARSGINTVHHDVIDSNRWIRQINLRVHPLESVRVYLDWLPVSGAVFYTSTNAGAVPVDGQPDAGVGATFPSWVLMRTARGGNLLLIDVPSSPLYQSKEFFWQDDASWDDAVPGKTGYGDDDDSAYGAHGFTLFDTGSSEIDPIRMRMESFPLCGAEGDPALATTVEEYAENPLEPMPLPAAGCGAVRALQVSVAGGDVVLDWEATLSAQAYRVYTSDDSTLPYGSWTVAVETGALTWTDAGAAGAGDRFYSVVCTRDGIDGPR